MLKDKIILVSGSSGLIGKAIVNDIHRKGGIPICLDIVSEDPTNYEYIYCDITDIRSINNAIKEVLSTYGRIDGLVNNAYPRTTDWGLDFLEIPEHSLKENIDWQLTSYLLFCQQVISKSMLKTGGSIVNITSIYGVVGNDFTVYKNTAITPPAAYTAIKGGLISFSRYLASKYGRNKIRVNCVSPGGIKDRQPELFIDSYEAKVPLGRMGYPIDIAPSVSFLLSDEAGYITGHNLIVDGGWTAI